MSTLDDIVLESATQWNEWLLVIKQLSIEGGLWHKIDPDNNEPPAFLAQPPASDWNGDLRIAKFNISKCIIHDNRYFEEVKRITKIRVWITRHTDRNLYLDAAAGTTTVRDILVNLKASVGHDGFQWC